MKARSVLFKIVVAALSLTPLCLWAQDGLEGALSRVNLASPARLGKPFSQPLAAADFDGDHKPDGAVLVEAGGTGQRAGFRTIEVHFTNRKNSELTFASTETSLALSALDVNRDGTVDIVVEHPLTHKRLQVWLNDGRGGFREGRNEDFTAPDVGSYEQVQSPSDERDHLAIFTTQGRSFAIGDWAMSRILPGSYSACKTGQSFEAFIKSHAIAASSPRAPPQS